MNAAMEIVDPHFHLIDVESNPYPWLEPTASRPNIFAGHDEHLREVFIAEDFRRATVNQHVVKAVHVQANWDHADPAGETEWLAGVAAANGFPNGVVAYANLADATVEDLLSQHASYSFTRGIRQILNWHDDPRLRFTDRPDYMTDRSWLTGFSLLQKYNLSYDSQIYYHQFDELLGVARRFPEVQIILNHAGMPLDRSTEALRAWSDAMARLATAPNVAVKISGLGLAQRAWTVDAVRPIVLGAIDAFGVDRAMFASNYPVEGIWVDYDGLVEGFSDILAGFSSDERTAFFKSNAERIYRI